MQVRIIDFDPVRFINFEAEINYPVEEGIIQVAGVLSTCSCRSCLFPASVFVCKFLLQIENFGMHLNVDGTVLYAALDLTHLETCAQIVTLCSVTA